MANLFKNPIKITVFTVIFAALVFNGSTSIREIKAESTVASEGAQMAVIQANSLLPVYSEAPVKPMDVKTIKMTVTAYSSTPEETDSTPFITASGLNVGDGIVANNMLSFGTKVRIPEIYGSKIFEVQDRMNARKSDYHLDIWFPEHEQAENFGVKTALIEVLDY